MEHQVQWEFFTGKLEQGSLSHAYIVSGSENCGKKEFVTQFLQYLFCTEKKRGCGKCITCLNVAKNQFPDLLEIKRKEDKEEIEIAQVKKVQEFLLYTPYYGKYKVVVVDEADKMNHEAQNCFLKTLEEPNGSALIFLLASKPELLLETIRSRCQQVALFAGKEKGAQDFATISALAKATFAEKFKAAKDSENPKLILDELEKYLRHLLMAKIGVEKSSENLEAYSVKQLADALERVTEIQGTVLFTNANQKMALEIALMQL
jgi:DNA polymerase III delta' subunit